MLSKKSEKSVTVCARKPFDLGPTDWIKDKSVEKLCRFFHSHGFVLVELSTDRLYIDRIAVKRVGFNDGKHFESKLHSWTDHDKKKRRKMSVGGVKTKTASYNKRKDDENEAFVSRVKTFLGPIDKIRAILLDDLNDNNDEARSLACWVRHGGIASNVWVPNPDPIIVDVVTRMGGRGRCLDLKDFVLTGEASDVTALYLDFCKGWATQGSFVKLLFQVGLDSASSSK